MPHSSHSNCEIKCHSCIRLSKCEFVSATLTKSASPTSYSETGDVITYTYTITNTGNVPICSPIQICDDRLGQQVISGSSILPGGNQVVTRTYVITANDLLCSSITNTATAYIQVKRKKWLCTAPASATITNEMGRWDYIIVGLGSAGSILARKLSDDNVTRVLVLEAGINREDDPVVLNPNWLANANTLLYNPSYSINYPVIRSFLSAQMYAEGAGSWGGSSAHNFLIAVRGTPRIYDYWAAVSGNPLWSYSNLLPIMKAVENYTPYNTAFDPLQRGSGGPISITQGDGVTGNTYLQNFSTFSNTAFFADYNDPPGGDCCISPVQQLITPPAPSGTRRSYSTLEFLPVGTIIDSNGNGLNGRKLKIISNARALRINVDANKNATGVEYVFTGSPDAVVTATLKSTGTLILCAGSVQTPKLLLNSGIGPAADLTAVGIPVILDSPNIGVAGQCQYGPSVIVAGTGAGSMPFEAETFTDGSSTGLVGGYTGGANDGIRRMQTINIPLGPDSFQVLMSISDPTSLCSVKIVDSDPLLQPQVNMSFYNGAETGPDGQLVLVTAKTIQAASTASGYTVVSPPPSVFVDDATLLAALSTPSETTIQSHLCGTCKMGTSIANGVVDGNLKVFGLNNVRIADASVFPLSPDGNTCYPVYVLAENLAKILGVPTPPAL